MLRGGVHSCGIIAVKGILTHFLACFTMCTSQKLKKAVYREAQKIIREKRRRDPTFELTEMVNGPNGYDDPFSSSEEEDSEEEAERKMKEAASPTWRQRHSNRPRIFAATADMTLGVGTGVGVGVGVEEDETEEEDMKSLDETTLFGSGTSPGGSTAFSPHRTPTTVMSHSSGPISGGGGQGEAPLLVLDSISASRPTSPFAKDWGEEEKEEEEEEEEDFDDKDTVYSRESAKYPRITRQTLDLFGGKEMEKEARYMKRMEQKRLDALKPKTLYERLQLEKEAAESEEAKKNAKKLKSSKMKKGRVSAFEQARRGSVIMRQASTSRSGQEAYKQQLYSRIATCSHCKTKMSFCSGCQKYVTRFLETNADITKQYNQRKEAIFRHIKKKLDSKDFVVGVGDSLESSILDVLKYLSLKETESSERMKSRDVEFRRREKSFKEELEGEIYEEVDLHEHVDGVNMFSDPDVVDPFFEENVITDWVEKGVAKELYIPKEMQNPWTGDGGEKRWEVNELPRKRQAGQSTFEGEGVKGYEEIFV